MKFFNWFHRQKLSYAVSLDGWAAMESELQNLAQRLSDQDKKLGRIERMLYRAGLKVNGDGDFENVIEDPPPPPQQELRAGQPTYSV